MPIRAVSFDLFDTLVDLCFEDVPMLEVDGMRVPESARILHAAVAEEAEVSFPRFVAANVAVDRELRVERLDRDLELPTLERFQALLARLDVRDGGLAGRLTDLHMGHIRERVAVPEHHGELLRGLRTRVRLGLCSNFSHAATAHRILEEAALGRHLESVVISETVGIRKPAAAIFDVVLGDLGVSAEETLHVGDSLRADVGGGAARGMATAWLTRRIRDPEARLAAHEGPQPDWILSDLSELPALLDRLAQ